MKSRFWLWGGIVGFILGVILALLAQFVLFGLCFEHGPPICLTLASLLPVAIIFPVVGAVLFPVVWRRLR